MLRKIFLISLALLFPVQSWAGLDMSFKHQTNIAGVAAQEISHNCHQAVDLHAKLIQLAP